MAKTEPRRKVGGLPQQVERAVAGWREAGRALGLSDRDMEDFADAFEHPERTAAQKHSA